MMLKGLTLGNYKSKNKKICTFIYYKGYNNTGDVETFSFYLTWIVYHGDNSWSRVPGRRIKRVLLSMSKNIFQITELYVTIFYNNI